MVKALRILPASVFMSLLVSGCASTRAPFPGEPATFGADSRCIVWPLPPASPRIAYVRSITGARDLGVRSSLLRRALSTLVGLDVRRRDFVNPVGVSIDGQENLCVADPGARAIYYFEHRDRMFRRWTAIGKHKLVSPVAVVKDGKVLFAADSTLGKVFAFDVKGRHLFVIDKVIKRPTGLTISGDKLVVVDSALHKIMLFSKDGRYVSEFGGRGKEPGRFNYPTHAALDADGSMYITDAMNHRVQVFDGSAVFKRAVGGIGDGTGYFSRPKGVATDRLGRIYVVDALFDTVQVFDRRGQFLLNWGEAGRDPGQFWLPAGIAISTNNYIYVADQFNRRIQVFKYVGE